MPYSSPEHVDHVNVEIDVFDNLRKDIELQWTSGGSPNLHWKYTYTQMPWENQESGTETKELYSQ